MGNQKTKKTKSGDRSELVVKAAKAWARTGRPANAMKTMTDAEIIKLAAMSEGPDNDAVPGFTEKMRVFIGEYYENRKASED